MCTQLSNQRGIRSNRWANQQTLKSWHDISGTTRSSWVGCAILQEILWNPCTQKKHDSQTARSFNWFARNTTNDAQCWLLQLCQVTTLKETIGKTCTTSWRWTIRSISIKRRWIKNQKTHLPIANLVSSKTQKKDYIVTYLSEHSQPNQTSLSHTNQLQEIHHSTADNRFKVGSIPSSESDEHTGQLTRCHLLHNYQSQIQ